MQRVVNGHYADPNSTRDLIGITPKQFEIMVGCLQFVYKAIEDILSAKPEDRLRIFTAAVKTEMVPKGLSADDIEVELMEKEEIEINRMNIIYEILKDINQPYPGAEY